MELSFIGGKYIWRSVNKQEVDFIVGDKMAIEVKSTKKVSSKHFSGLNAPREEGKIEKFFLVSEDSINRIEKDFLKKLWNDEIF